MKQYALGGSFEDLEYMTICFNTGGICVRHMGVNKIKSLQTGRRLPCVYFNHTNVSASSSFGDALK